MAYKNIVFAKLEKRLFNDHRWYMMSETAQLNFIRFILFAQETYNKIPKNLEAIKKAFKTDQDLKIIEESIKEIKNNFPKFRENKHYYYFKGFEEKTNYVKAREKPGNTRAIAQQGVYKEEEKEKEKDKDKEEDTTKFDHEIANRFIKRAKENFRTVKTDQQVFIKSIRDLRKLDKLTEEEILLITDYLETRKVLRGDFSWFDVIQSPRKLRDRTNNGKGMKFYECVLKEIKKIEEPF